MKRVVSLISLLLCPLVLLVDSFLIHNQNHVITTTTTTKTRITININTSNSRLYAIGPLVKKAKQNELREYVKSGIPDDVMEKYKEMKSKMETITDDDLRKSSSSIIGPLQQSLMKRKGTITVIAEYKRKLNEAESGYITKDVYDAEILSATFREFGASAIAVMADMKMGGCDYDTIYTFVEEQRRAQHKVPGPVPIINNDLIIDEIQIVRSSLLNVAAIVLQYQFFKDNIDELKTLMKAAKALDLEVIVAVSNTEHAQNAINIGATMISIIHVDGIDPKVEIIQGLQLPDENQNNVCFIANILAKNNKQLHEIEEAWGVRDKGFHTAWVGEALYKSGSDQTEHPGAIIKAMKSKSSLRWASPKASSGRGEGAREYLGDIMM